MRATKSATAASARCKYPGRLPAVFVTCILLLLMFLGFALTSAAEKKTKVLIITGGHGFEKEPFFKIFADDPEITFTAAEHSKVHASAYERDALLSYDVVVLYDMPKEITESQKAKFLSLFEKGIGVVVLHHALVSYPNWP